MKLQVAIDRTSLNDAIKMTHELDGIADIIELGTSLVKDYGLVKLKEKNISLNSSKLLIDLKTIDEGAYEFSKGFDTNADILTVMGSAGKATLDKVYEISEQRHKMMLIDLMNLTNNEISAISNYPNAIYNLHHSKDAGTTKNVVKLISDFRKNFPSISKVAIAGGIDLEQAKELQHQNLTDVVIVGSKIINARNPIIAAKAFKEAVSQ